MRLLLIEDDPDLQTTLRRTLERKGMQVGVCADGRQALAQWQSMAPDVVLLDLSLPGIDGLDLLSQARSCGLGTPVLILTARGTVGDRILGLNAGADDYLSKPFNARELVARIRAVLRRTEARAAAAPEVERIVVGDLELVPSALGCRIGGEPVALTSAEFSLLEVLAKTAGRVVSRDELSEKVLGRPLSPYDRSLDVHVSNLRKKLARGRDEPERIKTVRGTGYLYAVDAGV